MKYKNINIVNIKEANAITHGGTFHADEVFATVVLSKILPEVKLCRIFKITNEIPKNAIIYDFGGGEFDHHIKGYNKMRPNGIKYSAFGLLWKKFGKELLKKVEKKEEVFYLLDKTFVSAIDAADNGQVIKNKVIPVITLSSVIATFNPNWDENEDYDENFLKAVEYAEKIFDNELKKAISKINAKEKVEKAIEESKNGILLLERYMPWQEQLFATKSQKAKEICFVIFPSNRGGYNAVAVPDLDGYLWKKKLFPEEWAGLTGEKLAEVAGVKSASFCHLGRFIASAQTLEDILLMVQKAIEA